MSRKQPYSTIMLALIIPLMLVGLLLAVVRSEPAAARDVAQSLNQAAMEPAVMKNGQVEYAPGRVVVKFRSELNITTEQGSLSTGKVQLDSLLATQQVTGMRPLVVPGELRSDNTNADLSRIYLLELVAGQDVLQAACGIGK